MSTWGTSWAPAGNTAAATLPVEPPAPRAIARRLGDTARTSGQLGFELVDHIVPQRKPLEDDYQLCLDIPLLTPRVAPGEAPTGEPRHRRIAQRWVSALLETATGRRDRRQLDRFLDRGVDPRLAELATARVSQIHSCSPHREVIYVVVAVRFGRRVRALSAELRSRSDSWRYTAIDLL